MASNLFGRAAQALGRVATRNAGRASPPPSPAAVVNSILSTLGPLGKFITAIISGPGQQLRRDSEVDAARQVLEALNRQRYDREAREAEALIRRRLDDPPAPPVPQPQPAPARTPPVVPPQAPPTAPGGEYDDIQLLGRGAFYYQPDIEELVSREHRTPGSSNVYSFMWEHETPRVGILYVTFKAWIPGQGKSNSPGPTYAYYDVPTRVYRQFQAAATDSAGGAVWDYLRERGSVHGHQYQYRVVAGTLMQDGGSYVPRKATRAGFKNRAVTNVGAGRRGFTRSSLPEQNFLPNRATPNRGDNGAPDRGRS